MIQQLQIKICFIAFRNQKIKNFDTKIQNIALGLFLATIMQSCRDNEPTPNNSAIYNVEKGVVMQLGKKLENPYSVKNIEKKRWRT